MKHENMQRLDGILYLLGQCNGWIDGILYLLGLGSMLITSTMSAELSRGV